MFPLFDPREPIPSTIITAWPVCVPTLGARPLADRRGGDRGRATCLGRQLGDLVSPTSVFGRFAR